MNRRGWWWLADLRSGARVVEAELPPGYTPPSASMNPRATVTPVVPTLPAKVTNARAQITQVGRWGYEIHISYELNTELGPLELLAGPDKGVWLRWGRRRAETKARRELARFRAEQERETWTIR